MTLHLHSPAFEDGRDIPRRFTADGQNLSPPLEWEGAPQGTRSFVLLVEDPDAPRGTFRHWAAYDIAPDRTRIGEGVSDGMNMGVNDCGHAEYDGPAPPRGHGTHHYHFRLAALDVDHLPVSRSADAVAVWQAARAHVIEETEIVGTYRR